MGIIQIDNDNDGDGDGGGGVVGGDGFVKDITQYVLISQ